jgi:CRP-like cAMP-binding protein
VSSPSTPFESLPQRVRQAVLAGGHERHFPDAGVIVREGERGDALFIITSGRTSVQVLSASGDVVTTALLGPGDCFGELSFFGERPLRSATIQAIGPVTAVKLTREDVDRLRAHDCDIDRLLLEVMAAQVRRLTTLLVEAHHVRSETRILRRLNAAAELFANGAGPVSVPLTQDELASMAGASRPTANRVLRDLEADGIVQRRHGRIEVMDQAGLSARAKEWSS